MFPVKKEALNASEIKQEGMLDDLALSLQSSVEKAGVAVANLYAGILEDIRTKLEAQAKKWEGEKEALMKKIEELQFKYNQSILERDIAIRERDISIQERDISIQERDISIQERDISIQQLKEIEDLFKAVCKKRSSLSGIAEKGISKSKKMRLKQRAAKERYKLREAAEAALLAANGINVPQAHVSHTVTSGCSTANDTSSSTSANATSPSTSANTVKVKQEVEDDPMMCADD